jgi:hypothetical protein
LGALLIPVTEVWPGLTLIIAGWLLVGSSRMLDQRAMIRSLIAGARVIDAADLDPARVPPQLTLDVFAGDFLGERLGGAALVERGDELLGLIGTLQIRRIPRKSWTMTRTEQAMVPVVNVPRTSGDADLWPALEALERSGLDAFLVGPVGQGSALLTRRSASQLIRERAQARAVELRTGLPGLRFPGRRSPKPDRPAGQPNDEPAEEPNDERKDG